MSVPAGKRLAPSPEGQPERGSAPVITDESEGAPPPPPPPPPQPEANAPPAGDVTVPATGTPPPAPSVVPPMPPSDIEEVVKVLSDPTNLTKERVDEAYKSLARRRALLDEEIKRMDAGLVRLRDIAATAKDKRLPCFGQFDPAAPFCTVTCRDPVCPSYTAATKHARLASMAPAMARQVENMGETEASFAKHAPTDIPNGLADGTPVVVGD